MNLKPQREGEKMKSKDEKKINFFRKCLLYFAIFLSNISDFILNHWGLKNEEYL